MFPQDGSIVKSSDHELTATFRRKSKFHAKSADAKPKTHGGTSLDLAWVDEEADFEIVRMNEQRTVNTAGKMLYTLTPLDDPSAVAHPWVFDRLEQWREGDDDIGVIFLKSLDNPYTPEVEKRRLIKRFEGLPEAKARLEGIPSVRRVSTTSDGRRGPPSGSPPIPSPAA